MPIPTPVDLLFPPKCIICQSLVGLREIICPDCARELHPTGSQAEQHGDFFDACYSPFFYEEPLRASFLRYKFGGRKSYAKTYGKWMSNCLGSKALPKCDLVTWAPLSRLRRWKRGYDQAELLAREIAPALGLSAKPCLCKAYRKPLSRLSGEKSARMARIMGAYSLRPGVNVAGKSLILVDDLTTSGATLSECARVLKTAGAKRVICVTLARKPVK